MTEFDDLEVKHLNGETMKIQFQADMQHLRMEGKGMPLSEPSPEKTHGDMVVLFTNNS